MNATLSRLSPAAFVLALAGLAGCQPCYAELDTYVVDSAFTGEATGPAALGLPAPLRTGQTGGLPIPCVQSRAGCDVEPSVSATLGTRELTIIVGVHHLGTEAITLGPEARVRALIVDGASGEEEPLALRSGRLALVQSQDRAEVTVDLELARASGEPITAHATMTGVGHTETYCTGD